jgi:MoxR-like ATPase
MPADIVGTNLIVEGDDGRRQFQFEPGPIFANLVLADEINRATPKTQSAMLEAMQERSVTVAKATRRLPEPFFVLATQNPLEMEGTYPLPEAQLDRFFFKIDVPFPTVQDLVQIANRTTGEATPAAQPAADGGAIVQMQALARGVPIAEHVTAYAAQLLKATHPQEAEAPQEVQRYVRYGASARAACRP